MAVGYGGQRIMLVPSLDVAMVLTAGMYRSRAQTDITFEVLLDGVLPAIGKSYSFSGADASVRGSSSGSSFAAA